MKGCPLKFLGVLYCYVVFWGDYGAARIVDDFFDIKGQKILLLNEFCN